MPEIQEPLNWWWEPPIDSELVALGADADHCYGAARTELKAARDRPRLPARCQLIWRLARKCRLLTLTVSAPLFGRPAYLVPWGDEVRWPSGPAGLAVLCRRSSQAEDGVPF